MPSIININGNSFEERNGKIYLNGKEVIKHSVCVDKTGFKPWQIALIFAIFGFLVGLYI